MGKVPEKASRMVHFCVLSTVAHLKYSFQFDTVMGAKQRGLGTKQAIFPFLVLYALSSWSCRFMKIYSCFQNRTKLGLLYFYIILSLGKLLKSYSLEECQYYSILRDVLWSKTCEKCDLLGLQEVQFSICIGYKINRSSSPLYGVMQYFVWLRKKINRMLLNQIL